MRTKNRLLVAVRKHLGIIIFFLQRQRVIMKIENFQKSQIFGMVWFFVKKCVVS